jgi:hypothetical protein
LRGLFNVRIAVKNELRLGKWFPRQMELASRHHSVSIRATFQDVVLALFIVALPAIADEPSAKRALTVDDLYRLVAPAAPTLSGDGKGLAYARQ